MRLLEGQSVAGKILLNLKRQIVHDQLSPCLAIVLVGADPASLNYIKQKQKAADFVGIATKLYQLDSRASYWQVIALIDQLNRTDRVNGILVQLPLPKAISPEIVGVSIDRMKDVDGFRFELFKPPAALAIIELLKEYQIEVKGKKIVIIGNGFLIGRPFAKLSRALGARVETINSQTPRARQLARSAQILVSATGQARLIDRSWVKPGQVVVDAGGGYIDQNRTPKFVGEINFDQVAPIVNAISPNPAGVGPMTVAMLMANVVKAAKIQQAMASQSDRKSVPGRPI